MVTNYSVQNIKRHNKDGIPMCDRAFKFQPLVQIDACPFVSSLSLLPERLTAGHMFLWHARISSPYLL
jgi:hypothetical protein